jgi:hypothetical protein
MVRACKIGQSEDMRGLAFGLLVHKGRYSMAFRPRLARIVIAVSAAFLANCSSRLPEPPVAAQPPNALVEVDYPPPPARVEFLPSQPASDTVWIKGEWLWSGRRWSWRPGMWVVPIQGAGYARRALVRRADGKLFFAPGTWRDRQGRELPAPAEKTARSASGAVVNPEGETEPTGANVHNDAGPDGGEPPHDEPGADGGGV